MLSELLTVDSLLRAYQVSVGSVGSVRRVGAWGAWGWGVCGVLEGVWSVREYGECEGVLEGMWSMRECGEYGKCRGAWGV